MKLQNKHKQLIALAIGLAIIIFGVLQALFKFKIDAKVTDEVTMVLFILAFALLFSGRTKKAGSDKAPEQAGSQDGQAPAESLDTGETPAGGAADDSDEAMQDDEQNSKGEGN